MIANRKYHILAAAIFLACFVWILFLTQGLPIGDPDDWDHVLVAQDMRWRELTLKFITPWSSSHLWTGQVDRINEMTNRRLFLTIVLKSISSVFGLQSFPFYIFSKALFFSGTLSLLFLLLIAVTGSIFLSLAGAIFFLFVPAHYPHVLWITDPITMVHCFMLIGLFSYLKAIENLEQNKPIRDFMTPFFLTFFAGYVAIRTKEPGLTFPVIIGLYTLFLILKWKSNRRELFLVLLASAAIALQIIPINALVEPGDSHFPVFHRSHIVRMLFRNYDAGYDDEPVSAFFSLEQLWPVSIARTFGFFLLWTLVLFAVLYWAGKLTLKKRAFVCYSDHPLVIICIFWVIVEILLMGLFQTDPRYFSGTMIPLTLLAVRLIYCVSHMYPISWKKWLWVVPLFSFVWAVCYSNFSHVIYLRRLIGQRSERFLSLTRDIYADSFPEFSQDLRSLALFYCAAYVPKTNWPRMRNVSYFVDMGYDAWNKLETGTKEEFREFSKKGFRYYAGFEKDKFGSGPEIQTLAVIDGVNLTSLFEQILYRTRKKPVPMYIFKYDVNSA